MANALYMLVRMHLNVVTMTFDNYFCFWLGKWCSSSYDVCSILVTVRYVIFGAFVETIFEVTAVAISRVIYLVL